MKSVIFSLAKVQLVYKQVCKVNNFVLVHLPPLFYSGQGPYRVDDNKYFLIYSEQNRPLFFVIVFQIFIIIPIAQTILNRFLLDSICLFCSCPLKMIYFNFYNLVKVF